MDVNISTDIFMRFNDLEQELLTEVWDHLQMCTFF